MDKIYILWTFGISEEEKKQHPRHFQAVFSRPETAEIRAETMSYTLCREILAWKTDKNGDTQASNSYITYLVSGHEVTKTVAEKLKETNATIVKHEDFTTTKIDGAKTQKLAKEDPDLWSEDKWKREQGYDSYREASEANPGSNISFVCKNRKWFVEKEEDGYTKCRRENPDKIIKWDYNEGKWVAVSPEEANGWTPGKKEAERIQDAITIPASNPPSDSGIPAAPAIQISGTPWKPHAG